MSQLKSHTSHGSGVLDRTWRPLASIRLAEHRPQRRLVVVCALPAFHNLGGSPVRKTTLLSPGGRMASVDCAAVASPARDLSPAADGASEPIVELQEYIRAGPLLGVCGIQPADVSAHLDRWLQLGQQLAKQMEFDHDKLTDVQRLRIYHYYLPVYFWCEAQLEAHRSSGSQQALVIGISAPQGCGKSTLVEQLEALFNANGKHAASVSIDDFYLTNKDQTDLGAANPGNPLLQYRGNAGSHDLQLGTDTLKALRNLSGPGTASVPRYDKSLFAGRGDRAPAATWPLVQGPLQIVLFEGWMSGFRPLPEDSQAEAVSTGLGAVNAALRGYKEAWDLLVDAWLVIRIGDPQWVYKWRLQAEERMRASGKAGMTDEQVADFVARFQPAYKAYLAGLYEQGPTTARPGHTLIIEVDHSRSPLQQQPAPVVGSAGEQDGAEPDSKRQRTDDTDK